MLQFLATLNHTLSSLQHRLSLLFTNKSSSWRILPKQLIQSTSLSHRFASNSIAPNGNTVSNSIASNGNIVSTSIVPICKIVSHNTVDKSNLLLSNTHFLLVSFSMYSKYQRNRLSFSFKSIFWCTALDYFTSSPVSATCLIVSVGIFLLFSRNEPPSCLSLHPSLTILW